MRRWIRILAALLAAAALTGCDLEKLDYDPEPKPPANPRPANTTVLEPQAPGTVTMGTELASLDASCTADGYFQVRYNGAAQRAKVQVTNPDGTLYTYTLQPGAYETLPLTGGSGTYGVTVLENAFDNIYAMIYAAELPVPRVDEFLPYLYPNQYVWYTPQSQVYSLGVELTGLCEDDLGYVNQVYSYVVANIDYDDDLAATVPTDYLSDIDHTLAVGKGICVDYAALMTALLRSQGIPTKVVVGYSGQTYHAWISVYMEQTGWVEGVIYFDGTSWSRLDPTLAAGNRGTSVKDYVNNNDNYTEKYFY